MKTLNALAAIVFTANVYSADETLLRLRDRVEVAWSNRISAALPAWKVKEQSSAQQTRWEFDRDNKPGIVSGATLLNQRVHSGEAEVWLHIWCCETEADSELAYGAHINRMPISGRHISGLGSDATLFTVTEDSRRGTIFVRQGRFFVHISFSERSGGEVLAKTLVGALESLPKGD